MGTHEQAKSDHHDPHRNPADQIEDAKLFLCAFFDSDLHLPRFLKINKSKKRIPNTRKMANATAPDATKNCSISTPMGLAVAVMQVLVLQSAFALTQSVLRKHRRPISLESSF